MNIHATKITQTNKDGKTIISVEKIFGFMCQANEERAKELHLEDEVARLSNMRSTINLN